MSHTVSHTKSGTLCFSCRVYAERLNHAHNCTRRWSQTVTHSVWPTSEIKFKDSQASRVLSFEKAFLQRHPFPKGEEHLSFSFAHFLNLLFLVANRKRGIAPALIMAIRCVSALFGRSTLRLASCWILSSEYVPEKSDLPCQELLGKVSSPSQLPSWKF